MVREDWTFPSLVVADSIGGPSKTYDSSFVLSKSFFSFPSNNASTLPSEYEDLKILKSQVLVGKQSL